MGAGGTRILVVVPKGPESLGYETSQWDLTSSVGCPKKVVSLESTLPSDKSSAWEFQLWLGSLRIGSGGVPAMVQWLTNRTKNHEVAGLIPGLAQ